MVKVGDIFETSWGYEQTNVDFFQVVKVTGKSVVVRHIKSKETEIKDASGISTMTGHVVPVKNAFDGEPKTRRLRIGYGGAEVFDAGESYGTAELWNGKPQWVSHYA